LTLEECTEDSVQILPGVFPGFSIHKSQKPVCVDIPGGHIQNGAEMQIWDCNDSPAQTWWYSKIDSSIRPTANLDMCLDAGNDQKQGNKLILWECNQGDWQKWKFPAEDDADLSLGFANLKLEKKRSVRGRCHKGVYERQEVDDGKVLQGLSAFSSRSLGH